MTHFGVDHGHLTSFLQQKSTQLHRNSGDVALLNQFVSFRCSKPPSSLILPPRSHLQLLSDLFEQLLAPHVNAQPGEAEIAADLLARLILRDGPTFSARVMGAFGAEKG